MLRIWSVRNKSKMIAEYKARVSVRNLDVLSSARMERVKQSGVERGSVLNAWLPSVVHAWSVCDCRVLRANGRAKGQHDRHVVGPWLDLSGRACVARGFVISRIRLQVGEVADRDEQLVLQKWRRQNDSSLRGIGR